MIKYEIIEIEKLVKELNEASELYYNGKESPLTDAEFDIKLKKLKELEKEYNFVLSDSPTINVGSKPILNGIDTVEIQGKPMLSLDKVHLAKEIEDFSDGYDIIASIKCDGLSVRLIYEDGKLVSANTRGNGTEGSDISEHIKYFLNVPLVIKKKERYIIDGEAIIYDKDFAIVNKNGEFKNNRNTASGSLALLDMSIVKNRRLSFIAWDIIEGGFATQFHYNLEEAEDFGFTVVPALALDCTKVEELEIEEINKILLNVAKEKGIPCDGVVWKINDIKAGEAKGRTAHHWCNAIAWKPEIKEYETELLDIELSLGRTGVLTPVAIYKPIMIDGSECSRASLHNVSVMRDTLGIHPYTGQKIKIFKANEIIPQISWADTNEENVDWDKLIKVTCCPVCGGSLEIEDNNGIVTLWCANPDCEGKLANKVDHFCGKKGLDIKGISKATIEKLIDWGWINGFTDLFKLEEHSVEWKSKPGFGEASVNKIIFTINATRKSTKLESFISAIGIPLVGRTIAKEIVKYYSTWDEFRAAVGGDWTEFDGFGPEISKAINNFDYTEIDEVAGMLTFEQPESQNEENIMLAGEVFCITGKVNHWKNRDELKSYIENHGGKVVGSVSSNVTFLINNDATSTSAKNTTAKKLGIPIITEDEFLNNLY